MPTTVNFGWDYPTVGADIDTWGAKQNALFVQMDADLQATNDALAAGFVTAAASLATVDAKADANALAQAGFDGRITALEGIDYSAGITAAQDAANAAQGDATQALTDAATASTAASTAQTKADANETAFAALGVTEILTGTGAPPALSATQIYLKTT